MTTRARSCITLLLSAVTLGKLGLAVTPGAQAATIVVTGTADAVATDGACSLREAVLAANQDLAVDTCAAGSGADTIELPPGIYTLTIPGREEDGALTGDLDLTDELTLRGEGATSTVIEGGATTFDSVDRLLHVISTTAVVEDLTLARGRVTLSSVSPHGGGILVEAGGALTLRRSAVLDGTCTVTFGLGGVCNGGAIAVDGGSTALLEDSELRGNVAQWGGAVAVVDGSVTLRRATLRDNRSTARLGGAVHVAAGAFLEIDASALVRNRASSDCIGTCTPAGEGGALYNAGTTSVRSSTIADNLSLPGTGGTSGHGGGIRNLGTLDVRHSTIAGNHRGFSANGEPNGIDNAPGGTVLIESTVLADPCFGATGGITSAGHNLEPGTTCALVDLTDLPSTDPFLGATLVRSGTTYLRPPRLTSPAIDTASPLGCPAVDQRGSARPAEGDGLPPAACDRGAIEVPDPDDADGDLYADALDVCPAAPDPLQLDADDDGIGDACDTCTDVDGDGFGIVGASSGCADPAPDCDDEDASVNPSAAEIIANGKDDDCDAATPDCVGDEDGDGWYSTCYPSSVEDCDDTDPDVNPGATEIPLNGIDDDCASFTSDCIDLDGDGYPGDVCPLFPGPGDCDDTNPAVNPGQTEIPGNGVDDDCTVTTPGGCQPALANAAPAGRTGHQGRRGAMPMGPLVVAGLALAARTADRPRRRRRIAFIRPR